MSATLKPRFDPFLWAQLRPGVISARQAGGEDASQTFSAGNVPLVPENQIATSLRVVLHDTKSMMEKFSDKLGNLLSGVDQAKRQIDKTNDSFETGQERILEELVATVNRCQKGLLEAIDTPAQAPVLDEVRSSQTEAFQRLEQLQTRIDLLQNNLQTVSEQQNQIVACIAGITPLMTPLQDIPQQLHYMISLFSTLQPLFQGLPDQIKAILGETSTQNFETLQSTLAVSTSMEKHFESLNRIVSDSTKLITAIGGISCNPWEPTISHHSMTRTRSQASSSVLPSCDANTSMPLSGRNPTSNTIKRSWRDMHNSSRNNIMTFESQNGQDETNTDTTFDKSGMITSHPSVSRKTRSKGVSKHPRLLPRLAKPTAPAQNETSTSITSGKKKRGRPRKVVTQPVASFPDETGVLVEKRVANTNSASVVPPASTRVLRPRIPQRTTLNLTTKDNEIAPVFKETTTQFVDKSAASQVPHIQLSNHPSVVPAPLPVRRRTLLPFSECNQDIDIELDWGEINQI